ncbi:hypothetical protein CXG81DRAFT_19282 [Caulochytrium protostelioides]|uniref:Uncharacterized protein n=1 Tax=Caulochytrium protostelioides TaxID=1555241 RepID=A0A4P9X6M6_9FUNG|nr:hypothetical protein CXG81DRAFT_19282 [Caulochytrium protostelioides]|eukprot:RKP00844.1 hypothetical protein CXG81DRAFT_19282 [Caulochytrium protostelioides]
MAAPEATARVVLPLIEAPPSHPAPKSAAAAAATAATAAATETAAAAATPSSSPSSSPSPSPSPSSATATATATAADAAASTASPAPSDALSRPASPAARTAPFSGPAGGVPAVAPAAEPAGLASHIAAAATAAGPPWPQPGPTPPVVHADRGPSKWIDAAAAPPFKAKPRPKPVRATPAVASPRLPEAASHESLETLSPEADAAASADPGQPKPPRRRKMKPASALAISPPPAVATAATATASPRLPPAFPEGLGVGLTLSASGTGTGGPLSDDPFLPDFDRGSVVLPAHPSPMLEASPTALTAPPFPLGAAAGMALPPTVHTAPSPHATARGIGAGGNASRLSGRLSPIDLAGGPHRIGDAASSPVSTSTSASASTARPGAFAGVPEAIAAANRSEPRAARARLAIATSFAATSAAMAPTSTDPMLSPQHPDGLDPHRDAIAAAAIGGAGTHAVPHAAAALQTPPTAMALDASLPPATPAFALALNPTSSPLSAGADAAAVAAVAAAAATAPSSLMDFTHMMPNYGGVSRPAMLSVGPHAVHALASATLGHQQLHDYMAAQQQPPNAAAAGGYHPGRPPMAHGAASASVAMPMHPSSSEFWAGSPGGIGGYVAGHAGLSPQLAPVPPLIPSAAGLLGPSAPGGPPSPSLLSPHLLHPPHHHGHPHHGLSLPMPLSISIPPAPAPGTVPGSMVAAGAFERGHVLSAPASCRSPLMAPVSAMSPTAQQQQQQHAMLVLPAHHPMHLQHHSGSLPPAATSHPAAPSASHAAAMHHHYPAFGPPPLIPLAATQAAAAQRAPSPPPTVPPPRPSLSQLARLDAPFKKRRYVPQPRSLNDVLCCRAVRPHPGAGGDAAPSPAASSTPQPVWTSAAASAAMAGTWSHPTVQFIRWDVLIPEVGERHTLPRAQLVPQAASSTASSASSSSSSAPTTGTTPFTPATATKAATAASEPEPREAAVPSAAAASPSPPPPLGEPDARPWPDPQLAACLAEIAPPGVPNLHVHVRLNLATYSPFAVQNELVFQSRLPRLLANCLTVYQAGRRVYATRQIVVPTPHRVPRPGGHPRHAPAAAEPAPAAAPAGRGSGMRGRPRKRPRVGVGRPPASRDGSHEETAGPAAAAAAAAAAADDDEDSVLSPPMAPLPAYGSGRPEPPPPELADPGDEDAFTRVWTYSCPFLEGYLDALLACTTAARETLSAMVVVQTLEDLDASDVDHLPPVHVGVYTIDAEGGPAHPAARAPPGMVLQTDTPRAGPLRLGSIRAQPLSAIPRWGPARLVAWQWQPVMPTPFLIGAQPFLSPTGHGHGGRRRFPLPSLPQSLRGHAHLLPFSPAQVPSYLFTCGFTTELLAKAQMYGYQSRRCGRHASSAPSTPSAASPSRSWAPTPAPPAGEDGPDRGSQDVVAATPALDAVAPEGTQPLDAPTPLHAARGVNVQPEADAEADAKADRDADAASPSGPIAVPAVAAAAEPAAAVGAPAPLTDAGPGTPAAGPSAVPTPPRSVTPATASAAPCDAASPMPASPTSPTRSPRSFGGMEALQRDVTITLPRPAHLQVVRLVARAGETPVSIADGRWIFPELVKTGSATASTATASAAPQTASSKEAPRSAPAPAVPAAPAAPAAANAVPVAACSEPAAMPPAEERAAMDTRGSSPTPTPLEPAVGDVAMADAAADAVANAAAQTVVTPPMSLAAVEAIQHPVLSAAPSVTVAMTPGGPLTADPAAGPCPAAATTASPRAVDALSPLAAVGTAEPSAMASVLPEIAPATAVTLPPTPRLISPPIVSDAPNPASAVTDAAATDAAAIPATSPPREAMAVDGSPAVPAPASTVPIATTPAPATTTTADTTTTTTTAAETPASLKASPSAAPVADPASVARGLAQRLRELSAVPTVAASAAPATSSSALSAAGPAPPRASGRGGLQETTYQYTFSFTPALDTPWPSDCATCDLPRLMGPWLDVIDVVVEVAAATWMDAPEAGGGLHRTRVPTPPPRTPFGRIGSDHGMASGIPGAGAAAAAAAAPVPPVAASIRALVHAYLATRRVYPPEAFAAVSFAGLPTPRARVPALAAYIDACLAPLLDAADRDRSPYAAALRHVAASPSPPAGAAPSIAQPLRGWAAVHVLLFDTARQRQAPGDGAAPAAAAAADDDDDDDDDDPASWPQTQTQARTLTPPPPPPAARDPGTASHWPYPIREQLTIRIVHALADAAAGGRHEDDAAAATAAAAAAARGWRAVLLPLLALPTRHDSADRDDGDGEADGEAAAEAEADSDAWAPGAAWRIVLETAQDVAPATQRHVAQGMQAATVHATDPARAWLATRTAARPGAQPRPRADRFADDADADDDDDAMDGDASLDNADDDGVGAMVGFPDAVVVPVGQGRIGRDGTRLRLHVLARATSRHGTAPLTPQA